MFAKPEQAWYTILSVCIQRSKTMENITLIGMPGSGKSTVGIVLAKVRGMDFLDVDLLIQQREGALLQEIINTRGNEAFLDAEEQAVRSLACRGCVIAPGGSIICRKGGIEHLKQISLVVYLRLPLEEVKLRLGDISARGIALEQGQTIDGLYNSRVPLYEKYADCVVDCAEHLRLEDSVRAVQRKIQAHL